MTTAPIVNINGSSKQSLLKDHYEAYKAIENAINKLSVCSPHGRDYQISPAGDYGKARQEHYARMKQLDIIKTDIFNICFNINQQGE